MKKPLVSVNIRTFNSEETIKEALESVKNQTYKNIEILVSDGYSRDRTVEIAKSFGARIHFADKLGDARHQNYDKSKGKYVLSLDSDQVLDNGVIDRCVKLCEEKGFDAVSISEKSIIKKGTLVENLIAYDKWVIDKNKDQDVLFGTACPRFFRKVLLVDVKWTEGLSVFDDTILYVELLKKNARVAYLSSQSVRHQEVTSWSTFIKKFFRYGKGYFGALKANPGIIAAHSLPRRSYFSCVALSKPHYFLGLLFLYSVKALAAAIGVASYFVEKLVSSSKKH